MFNFDLLFQLLLFMDASPYMLGFAMETSFFAMDAVNCLIDQTRDMYNSLRSDKIIR